MNFHKISATLYDLKVFFKCFCIDSVFSYTRLMKEEVNYTRIDNDWSFIEKGGL